jgi:diguanylate cyclase (GGDEF)-like protein
MELELSKTKKTLIFIAGFFYLLTAVFTLADNKLGIEAGAPIATFMVLLVLMSNLKDLGPHKYSTAFMGIGFLAIDIYYIFRFLNHYVIDLSAYSEVIGIVYLTPSFFFMLNETTFLIYKLRGRRRDLSHLFANCFTVSIIGFVFIYKFFCQRVGTIHNLKELILLLLIFSAFYVIMMCLQTFHMVGNSNVRRGTLVITAAMFIYEIMDIQYIFTQAIGGFPDDYFADLIYMALLIFMSAGVTIQATRKYSFEFTGWSYTTRATRVRLIASVICVIVVAILFIIGYLSRSEASYIIIVVMSYMIMSYILKADNLGDELLEHEKRQNAMLEEKIDDQTRDLIEANKKLELLSSTDLLTGLYNRWYAGNYLKELQEKTYISGKKYLFFVINLNHFKPVNDTYGHEMGDRVLEELGNRMRELPDEYVSFRMGGDEFLIILKADAELEDLDPIAEHIRELFIKSIQFGSYVFNLSASIGISVYPQDSSSMDELLRYADTAMCFVKHSGEKDSYRFFNSGLTKIISTQAAIDRRLRTAKTDRDFILFYQPQVDVRKKEIIGAEVFVHFNRGLEDVSPIDIIDAAEKSGFMGKLGEWIVKSSVSQIAEWNKKYGKSISLTINMSPLQLINLQFENMLQETMETYNFQPSMLTLDVTNAVIMGASNSAKLAMIKLHEDGYRLSLNDFGGDDINLSFVQDCGINGIKLSRSLVTTSVKDNRAKQLVKTILALAENLGISVTAVGIENEEQSSNMQGLGVNELQGSFYGKPVVAEEFEKIISAE